MLVRVTEAALMRFHDLLAHHHAKGVRIGLRAKGCSGLSYSMEYATELIPEDKEVVLSPSVTLFLQKKALMFLIGTEIDYQETPVRSGFIFRNPKEKGRCGCGTSFYLSAQTSLP